LTQVGRNDSGGSLVASQPHLVSCLGNGSKVKRVVLLNG
jgi:hypothetical protein